MSPADRVEFWSCFGLKPPPAGFDDWFIAVTNTGNVLAAFPVEGFINGEPVENQFPTAAETVSV